MKYNIGYSVLMSVYKNDDPEHLKIAIESVLSQTLSPTQIVLVKDGPLNKKLDEIIFYNQCKYEIIDVVESKENIGLGNALNLGLAKCEHELIMRMDSDDYSLPNRAELMLKEFLTDESLDVVGTAVGEFMYDINKIDSYKFVPNTDSAIKERMKTRNPMNHPTVIFKKSSILEVKGYQEIKFNEDYFLWIRLAIENKKFKNLDYPLLYMKVSEDTFDRRYGYDYFINQKIIFEYMRMNKFGCVKNYV